MRICVKRGLVLSNLASNGFQESVRYVLSETRLSRLHDALICSCIKCISFRSASAGLMGASIVIAGYPLLLEQSLHQE